MKKATYKYYNNEYTQNSDKIDFQVVETHYKNHNTPLSEEEYTQLFHTFISEENFTSFGKEDILKKMYQDSLWVYQQLKLLPELGIQLKLDLTGGSVRDFILSKEQEIKDLDFMVSLDCKSLINHYLYSNYKNVYQESLKIKIKEIKQKENIDFYFIINLLEKFIPKKQEISPQKNDIEEVIPIDLNNDDFFIEGELEKALLAFCFEEKIEKNFFQNKVVNIETYSSERIKGVIKLKKQNYDIDLLITNYEKKEFVSSFDFNLCKASFSLIGFYHKDFPKEAEDLLSRTSIDVSFFADIQNQKLTINVDNLRDRDIKHAITNHYLRMKKKYPEYKMNIVGVNKSKLELANKYFYYSQLLNDLNYTNKVNIKHKI
jgi:hypothetical protein